MLPLLILVGALIAVRVHDAPLRSRAWMFAMPLFLVCAIAGVNGLWRKAGVARRTPVLALVAVCVVTVLEFATMRAVASQAYLCSEPNMQVNVPEVVDACRTYGAERCALVMRYTPAANFYRDLWDVASPLPTDAPQAERVYIVADEVDSVDDLWNASSPGFDHFAPAREFRKLASCTIYVADRRD